MAERSFAKEVQQLRSGNGVDFRGEGILAVTKALLQSGVSYVGGYQGSPISHLMDVLSDAREIMAELGIHFESSASEAAAGAMLAASVNYPLRGAVTWKSTVGTNVASDALANVASGGVTGGALIIVGEDYGEGSSIMQERTHAFAMKSQIWLLDPRPNLPSIVAMVEKAFELSEASNTPVMLELRVRACHLYGSFEAKDNVRATFQLKDAMENPVRDVSRIVLPPANYLHEHEKINKRWPAAVDFIKKNRLNEFLGGSLGDVGIVVQGGLYNTLIRALQIRGLADSYGETAIPLYVLNVTYPLIDSEVTGFCADKRAVLLVEEGQPEFIEHELNTILRRADLQTRVVGKELLPRAGEYTGQVIMAGVDAFIAKYAPHLQKDAPNAVAPVAPSPNAPDLSKVVPARPAGLCTGCPERPVFTAMQLVEKELGKHHVSCDIGCHLFSILPPFNIGNTTMGYGLGWAGASAFNDPNSKKRTISGDGRRRLLAQRPDQRGRQRGLQQDRQFAGGGRQQLFSGHRRPGHPVVAGREQIPQHQSSHRPRHRRDGRQLAEGCADLRSVGNARCSQDRAHDQRQGPQGHRRRIRMHAEQAAPSEAFDSETHQGRRAGGARTLRRRRRHLHRRSQLHPSVGLPFADDQRQSRSAADRSRRRGQQRLRRLRSLRRDRPRGCPVPVVLPRRHCLQSHRGAERLMARFRAGVIGWLQRRADDAPRPRHAV